MVAALLLYLALPAHGGEAVTFHSGPLKRKAQVDYVAELHMALDVNVSIGEQSLSGTMRLDEVQRIAFRVLATSRDGPERLEIRIDEKHSSESGMGIDSVSDSSAVGTTYEVLARGSELIVTEPGGERVRDAAIVADLHEAWGIFADLGSFVNELDSETVDVGHRIDMTAAGTLMGVSSSDSFQVVDGGITLTGKRTDRRDEWGTFVIEISGKSPEGGDADMTMDVTGNALVHTRTGLMSEMNLAGPVTMVSASEQDDTAMSGRGTVSFEQRAVLKQR